MLPSLFLSTIREERTFAFSPLAILNQSHLDVLKLVDGKALVGGLAVKDIPCENPHKSVNVGLAVGEILLSPISTLSHCITNLFIGVLDHPFAYTLIAGHFLHGHVVVACGADAFDLLPCQRQLDGSAAVLADVCVLVMNTGVASLLAFFVDSHIPYFFIVIACSLVVQSYKTFFIVT